MRYEFGGLIFGGAYFRNFTVLYVDLHTDKEKPQHRKASIYRSSCGELVDNRRGRIAERAQEFYERLYSSHSPDLEPPDPEVQN